VRPAWLIVAGCLFVLPASARVVRDPAPPPMERPAETGGVPIRSGAPGPRLCTAPDDTTMALAPWFISQPSGGSVPCVLQADSLQRTMAAIGLAMTQATARWQAFSGISLLRNFPVSWLNFLHTSHLGPPRH
jgi:hypothetical protein